MELWYDHNSSSLNNFKELYFSSWYLCPERQDCSASSGEASCFSNRRSDRKATEDVSFCPGGDLRETSDLKLAARAGIATLAVNELGARERENFVKVLWLQSTWAPPTPLVVAIFKSNVPSHRAIPIPHQREQQSNPNAGRSYACHAVSLDRLEVEPQRRKKKVLWPAILGIPGEKEQLEMWRKAGPRWLCLALPYAGPVKKGSRKAA